MIFSRLGNVAVEGNVSVIKADLSTIVLHINNVFTEKFGEEKAKEMIMEAVESGFKKPEEIEAEIVTCIKDFLERLGK